MQNKTLQNSERVYALDALRAVMMLLGIVLHSAITYGSMDYKTAWELKDPDNNLIFDLLVRLIHTFRMPVFFVAAGYFSALLFNKKGSKAMLANRIKRILLPFLVGVLIIYPINKFTSLFSQSVFSGAIAPFHNAAQTILSGKFLPFNVIHLWFLYLLMMYIILGWWLAILFKKENSFTVFLKNIFAYIFKKFWPRFFCMSFVFFLCLCWMKSPYILTNNNWQINPSIFVTYFVFFGTGWMIYKTNTLIKFEGYSILQLSIAGLLFLAFTFTHWPASRFTLYFKLLIASCYSILFIFGFISFFLKYFSHYSKRLAYLMDASYWVYIIHLPVVTFIPGLIANFSSGAFVKFVITFSLTCIICLISYKFMVRGTFVGMFLNGKIIRQKNVVEKHKPIVQL